MAVQTNILSDQEVRAFLGDLLDRENLSDAVLDIKSGSQKGDGYMSLVTKVSATGKNKALNLILKWAPRSEEFRKVMPLNKAFQREIYFYDVLAPALQKFQADRNVQEPFDSIATCYKTISEEYKELIVLDDLIAQGFRLYNRKILMDVQHIKYLLKQYGKLHALSFAMQDQDKKLYDEITNDVDDLIADDIEMLRKEISAGIENVLEIFNKKEDEGVRDALNSFKERMFPFLDSLATTRNKNHAILHGDCWCNNMMFKYEDGKSKPIGLRIFDFQIVRINSPVMDLSNALYASAPKEVYDNLEYYLRIYHNSYLDHMKALGSDGEKIYPFTELQKDWKKYYMYGYMLSTIIHKAAVRGEDNTIDMFDAVASGINSIDVFKVHGKAKLISDDRLRNLTMHVYESGLFDEK